MPANLEPTLAASAEDLRRLPLANKRPIVSTADTLTVEPDYEVAELQIISERKEVNGEIWYLVKGADVDKEDGPYQWVTEEEYAGQASGLILGLH
ncbi:hypothetical protein PsorP6_006899 [Peronosclerospora sorghi]|uniref:Uncharacterized protein n=1 Tax=Peronosclerospora sorghi TaxID=230839 RepID=A0ACC0W927_9STRA|nr:hypothetical protein PsorP6_006899 [Peronosclerospora sorghi]